VHEILLAENVSLNLVRVAESALVRLTLQHHHLGAVSMKREFCVHVSISTLVLFLAKLYFFTSVDSELEPEISKSDKKPIHYSFRLLVSDLVP